MVLTKLGILVRRFRIVSYPRGETTKELLSTRFFCRVAYLVLSPQMPKPPSSSTLPPQSGKTSFLREKQPHILATNLEAARCFSCCQKNADATMRYGRAKMTQISVFLYLQDF